jgi:type IV pilus assembly protein PilZ
LIEQRNNVEKRSDPRAPIELKVEYRRLNTFFADYTKNISRGGTFIKTHKPLEINTEFIFKLYIPSLDDPLQLTGQVQWVITPGEATEKKQPGMGIKFTYKDRSEREKIEQIVEKLMIDSLGRHLYEKLLKRYSYKPENKF